MNPQILQVINDPYRRQELLEQLLRGPSGSFVLSLGSTRTSDIEGVSAAGATALQRRLTPSVDADLLLFGAPRAGESVPISPDGIVSPVVISRACLHLMNIKPLVVDCGTFRAPLRSNRTAGTVPANCVSTGEALSIDQVNRLFEQGRNFVHCIRGNKFVVLGECVPGGTTTALALLKGLGVAADNLVSSSLTRVSDMRHPLVTAGLKKAGLDQRSRPLEPLPVVAAIGDPMQPFVAGLAMEAAKIMPVIFAGGSQMLAIFHLCNEIGRASGAPFNCENAFVVTTKWIVGDRHSNTTRLSELLKAPFFAAAPDFTESRYQGLSAYEAGHVKEGVGAGALMLWASYALGLSNSQLIAAIDRSYVQLTDTRVPKEPAVVF